MPSALSLCAGMAGKQLYDAAFGQAVGVVERGLVPDVLVRAGIRWLLGQRKREVGAALSAWGCWGFCSAARRLNNCLK